jgi:hypothetical protein
VPGTTGCTQISLGRGGSCGCVAMDEGAGVVVGGRARGDFPPSKSPELGAVLVTENNGPHVLRAGQGGWLGLAKSTPTTCVLVAFLRAQSTALPPCRGWVELIWPKKCAAASNHAHCHRLASLSEENGLLPLESPAEESYLREEMASPQPQPARSGPKITFV